MPEHSLLVEGGRQTDKCIHDDHSKQPSSSNDCSGFGFWLSVGARDPHRRPPSDQHRRPPSGDQKHRSKYNSLGGRVIVGWFHVADKVAQLYWPELHVPAGNRLCG